MRVALLAFFSLHLGIKRHKSGDNLCTLTWETSISALVLPGRSSDQCAPNRKRWRKSRAQGDQPSASTTRIVPDCFQFRLQQSNLGYVLYISSQLKSMWWQSFFQYPHEGAAALGLTANVMSPK